MVEQMLELRPAFLGHHRSDLAVHPFRAEVGLGVLVHNPVKTLRCLFIVALVEVSLADPESDRRLEVVRLSTALAERFLVRDAGGFVPAQRHVALAHHELGASRPVGFRVSDQERVELVQRDVLVVHVDEIVCGRAPVFDLAFEAGLCRCRSCQKKKRHQDEP
jgi:hypothetical protein